MSRLALVLLLGCGATPHSGEARAIDDWEARIAPVFRRVCSQCHATGGSSDIDLSTPAAWRTLRDKIRERVIDVRDMPPDDVVLPAADRAAIEHWLTQL